MTSWSMGRFALDGQDLYICTSSPCAFLKQGLELARVVLVHTEETWSMEWGANSSFITKRQSQVAAMFVPDS